jgi:hypothetical protein
VTVSLIVMLAGPATPWSIINQRKIALALWNPFGGRSHIVASIVCAILVIQYFFTQWQGTQTQAQPAAMATPWILQPLPSRALLLLTLCTTHSFWKCLWVL